jgi:hypothetical protein
MDLTILAYATLGLSLFVSAVKMGGWILHADPQTILNGGRWALVALAALALGVLLWLVMTGRWSSAMMLAAFMLPIFVQAAPRWRVLFGPLNAMRSDFHPITPDVSTPRGGFANAREMTDPELVQQSLAVLRAYLAQAGAQPATQQIEHTPEYLQGGNGAGTASGNGRLRMSTEEALDILGLEPTATAQEIRDAYCRLEQKLDPELGGTHYLMAKIIEARDVLLRA